MIVSRHNNKSLKVIFNIHFQGLLVISLLCCYGEDRSQTVAATVIRSLPSRPAPPTEYAEPVPSYNEAVGSDHSDAGAAFQQVAQMAVRYKPLFCVQNLKCQPTKGAYVYLFIKQSQSWTRMYD